MAALIPDTVGIFGKYSFIFEVIALAHCRLGDLTDVIFSDGAVGNSDVCLELRQQAPPEMLDEPMDMVERLAR